MLSTPQYCLQKCNSTNAPHNLFCITNILKTLKNCRNTTTHLLNACQLYTTIERLAYVHMLPLTHKITQLQKGSFCAVMSTFSQRRHSLPKEQSCRQRELCPQRKHKLADLSSAYSALRGLQMAEIRPFFVLASAKGSFIATVQASLKHIFLLWASSLSSWASGLQSPASSLRCRPCSLASHLRHGPQSLPSRRRSRASGPHSLRPHLNCWCVLSAHSRCMTMKLVNSKTRFLRWSWRCSGYRTKCRS